MTAQPATVEDGALHQLLTRADRGLGVVQDLIAVLREYERETLALVQQNQRLLASTWVDPLTGLRNRRGLDEALTREEARRRRSGVIAAVILVDVVGLKRVNEQFGHLVGDALLRAVGQAFIASARESDVLARFGGDEFVALLPGAETTGAEAFVARLRANARLANLPEGVPGPVRFTAGVATSDEAGSLNAALALADQRLIAEKQRSRDAATLPPTPAP